jgi:septum site-determining protein MinC
MINEQCVILKGQRDGISIMLDKDTDFATIETVLRKKVSGAKRFFEGADAVLSFKGRSLTEDEEQALLDIILTETALDVAFVESEGFMLPVARRTSVAPAHAVLTNSDTAFFRGCLRSGQYIRYNGSVVIIGDVNPGGEIIVNGNIIVLGSLRGMVHAGALGDATCFISALVMQPTQLRIANHITYIPATVKIERSTSKPSWAYVQDGQVFIAPLL